MRTRILCIPAIRGIEEGTRLLQTLAFHLHFVEADLIELVVDDEVHAELTGLRAALPPDTDMDGAVAGFYERISDRISLLPASQVAPDAWPYGTDYVAVWDPSRTAEWEEGLAAFYQRDRVVSAHDTTTSSANASLARFASRVLGEEGGSRRRSIELLESFLRRIAPVESATIVLDPKWDDLLGPGAVICPPNSTLLQNPGTRRGPCVVTVSDLEPYLGLSGESAEARANLAAVAEIPDSLIVLPNAFYASLTNLCPELAPLTVGLPAAQYGLTTNMSPAGLGFMEGAPLSTSIMLPIASMLTDEIRIVAAPTDAGTEDWETAIRGAEDGGSRVLSISESVLPALRRRTDKAYDPPAHHDGGAAEFMVVSVNPDWIDEMGHHAHFDRAMREATLAKGWTFQSLASKALRPEHPLWQSRVFTHATYGFETTRAEPFAKTFRDELRSALDRTAVDDNGIPRRVIMYSAGLAHLPGIIHAAAALVDGNTTFHVNLLRSHADLLAAVEATNPATTTFLLKEAIEVGQMLGVHLLADTEELNNIVEQLTGYRLKPWPMVGVTPLHQPDSPSTPRNRDNGVLTFCFPATQEIKGLSDFAALTEAMASESDSGRVRFLARDLGIGQPAVDTMRAAGVDLVSGVLEAAEYVEFMQQADVVVLPYKRNPFHIQTSGAVADAIKLRVPIIATADTWAGRLVDENGIGTTFTEGDLDGFRQAVSRLQEDYETYVARMRDFAPGWLDRNNAAALLDAISRPPTEVRPTPLARARAEHFAAFHERLAEARAGESARGSAESTWHHRAIADLTERLGQQERELDELSWTVRDLEHRLAVTRTTRDLTIAKLEAEISKRETKIETRDRELGDLNDTISRLETRIATRDGEIERWTAATARLEVELGTATQQHTATVAELREKLQDYRGRVAELEDRFSHRVWRAIKRRRP